MTYTMSQTENIAIEILIVSLVSTLTLIFTLYCYFKFPHLHNAQFKLVTRILISDLIYESIMLIVSITYFIYQNSQPLNDTHPVLCQFQAFMSNFSILSSTAWTSIICHTLYNQVFHNTLSKLYYYQYIFCGYLIPAIISFIPFFINAYGASYPMPQTNCFYNSDLPSNQFDLYISLCYYLPIWLAFLYNLTIMILIVVKIRLHIFDIASNRQLMGLFIYPSILAICWVIPGIISQLDVVNEAWNFTSQLLCNLVGFLDAICYCYTEIFSKLEFKSFRLSIKTSSTDDIIISTQNDLANLAQNSQQL